MERVVRCFGRVGEVCVCVRRFGFEKGLILERSGRGLDIVAFGCAAACEREGSHDGKAEEEDWRREACSGAG